MLTILSVTWHKLECPSMRLQVIMEWDAVSMFENVACYSVMYEVCVTVVFKISFYK